MDYKEIKINRNYVIRSDGKLFSKNYKNKGRFHEIKPTDNGRGYLSIIIKNEKGERKIQYIHRLVAEAFIENVFNYPTVDHINRNKKDNRVENLRWASLKMQAQNKENEVVKKRIPVVAIKGKEKMFFNGIVEASEKLGCKSSSSVGNVLQGFAKTCKGYKIKRITVR